MAAAAIFNIAKTKKMQNYEVYSNHGILKPMRRFAAGFRWKVHYFSFLIAVIQMSAY
jgi:hypothetical protein